MKNSSPPLIAYLLPNFFTAASIFTGFYAISLALHSQFESAAWFIFLALIFDGLDGRVARLTNTTSQFGIEFDSLADIVAFGVAPAFLLYMYIGESYGRIGVGISALFIIFGAVRLARFNVMTARIEPTVFIGLPIPTAAVMVSIAILFFENYYFASYKVILLPFAIVLSILMVSNIRYPSFKKINFRALHFTRFLTLAVIIALMIFIFPIEGMALLATTYLIYGPLRAAFFLIRRIFQRG